MSGLFQSASGLDATTGAVGVDTGSAVVISDGKRKIEISREKVQESKYRKALQDRPMNPKKPNALPAEALAFIPPRPTEMAFRVFGKVRMGAGERLQIVGKAFEKLGNELQQFEKEYGDAYRNLAKKLADLGLGTKMDGVAGEKSVKDLPKDVRDYLRANLKGSFKQHGFADENEAEQFFQNAKVDSFSASITFFGYNGNGGFEGIALPKP
ncbi:MAG: hypothetical protein EOP06_01665 [Proteobacteria bacterium]|nr:MAG: hypothetical protein EOP06_01665 [Pseudomonadota bacterium]